MIKILLLLACTLYYFHVVAQDSTKLDPSELLFNTTTKIECERDTLVNGKLRKVHVTATAFFFAFTGGDSNTTYPVIITTAHAVKGSLKGILRFNSKSQGQINYGDILELEFSDFGSLWLYHPNEDVAILPLVPIFNAIDIKYQKSISCTPLLEGYIPNEQVQRDLTSVEEVLMIGYPKGFSDTINNVPIIRKGITASPLNIDYNNQKRFLLDIPIYSGSSGSPVLIYNNATFATRGGGTVVGKRILFLGIAVQSKEYKARGKTLPSDQNQSVPTETSLPFEIAVVIRSSVLLEMKKAVLNLTQKHVWKMLNHTKY
jgi:V8-like Glu-specific endopeptidase